MNQLESEKDNAKEQELPPPWWPDLWVRVLYKTYPRFPKLPLNPEAGDLQKPFSDVLLDRISTEAFSGKPLSLQQMSNLLCFSAGISPWRKERRYYPSGGGRYPLEIYPLVLKSGEIIRSGLYHYNVKDNVLETLLEGEFLEAVKKLCLDWERWIDASVILIITAVATRSKVKYGEVKGNRIVLLDAGVLCENFYLVSAALGLECRAIGGFLDQEFVSELLDIDGVNEEPIFMFAVSAK